MKKYNVVRTFRYGGKQYKIYGNTEREVYQKMALKQHDLETGHVIVDGSMTVEQWSEKCFDTYKSSVQVESAKNQWYSYKKYVLPYIGMYAIKDVKPIQCQEILNSMAGKSWSLVKSVQTNLHFVFEKARQNKMIFENPAENLTRPKTVKGRRRSLTSYERRHFWNVIDKDPRYIFFRFMLECGCRPEEAAELRKTDIKEKDGCYLLHIRGTKTENSDRWVPLPEDLYECVADDGPFDLLCPNAAGHKHDTSSYKRMVSNFKRDLNISMGVQVYRNKLIPPLRLASDWVPYDLRHTYCTDLQRAGIDIRTAQKLMGHANISITADIYTHVDEDQILNAAKTLGAQKSDKNKKESI